MSTSTSLATSFNNSGFNDGLTDNGVVTRIRDGQTCICTAFSDLDIADGCPIEGITIFMEGYALVTGGDHGASTGDFIYVSNDGGTSWSTPKDINSGVWSTDSSAHAIEQAGEEDELWGMSWNATTANAIQVKFEWDTNNGDAIYLDYIQVRITYAKPVTNTISFNRGGVSFSRGTIEIK